MGTEFETIEARISPMLAQLQCECGILQRLVYKNRNQHRRSSYFLHLLKFHGMLYIIKGDRPKQKVHLFRE
ncbi:hypothetical protein HN51_055258, partial [Arachis hypogaea]